MDAGGEEIGLTPLTGVTIGTPFLKASVVTSLEQLINISGTALCDSKATLSPDLIKATGSLADELLGMLRIKNGFYAFESALHVFPTHQTPDEVSLRQWNAASLWRGAYPAIPDDCVVFAEDIFGGQFCIKDSEVHGFEPETGELEYIANNIENWANAILSDYPFVTGFEFGHRWQESNGPIPPRKRLLPKTPFVMGGEYSVENFYVTDSIEGMRLRGNIASQIQDSPDGTPVKFEITD